MSRRTKRIFFIERSEMKGVHYFLEFLPENLNEAAESCTIEGESPVVEKFSQELFKFLKKRSQTICLSRVAWDT